MAHSRLAFFDVTSRGVAGSCYDVVALPVVAEGREPWCQRPSLGRTRKERREMREGEKEEARTCKPVNTHLSMTIYRCTHAI
jgi:hypothetical protein